MTNPQIYWELKDEDGAVTASGWADSIKQCLIDVAIRNVAIRKGCSTVVVPPGLYVDGSPDRVKTPINL